MNKKIDLVELAQQFIRFRSVTPNDDGLLEYIISLLKNYGFNIIEKTFGDGLYQVKNLYAELKSSNDRALNVCFAGHVDVVPEGDINLWKHHPFSGIVDDNILYGRGAVDMKGAIAAYIAVVLNNIQDFSKHLTLSFLLTSDEEGIAEDGTKKMLEFITNQGYKIDYTILGEPTSSSKVGDMIKIGRRGSANFILDIFGKQGHPAYPHLADNALHKMSNILSSLTKYQFDNGTSYFDPTNLQITNLEVHNASTSLIPGHVSAKFNIRFNDMYTLDNLHTTVKSIVEQCTRNFELKYHSNAEPFIVKNNKMINAFKLGIKEINLKEPSITTTGGTSDARFIHKYSKTLECGLLSSTAHQINECVNVEDLHKLHSIYLKSIRYFIKDCGLGT